MYLLKLQKNEREQQWQEKFAEVGRYIRRSNIKKTDMEFGLKGWELNNWRVADSDGKGISFANQWHLRITSYSVENYRLEGISFANLWHKRNKEMFSGKSWTRKLFGGIYLFAWEIFLLHEWLTTVFISQYLTVFLIVLFCLSQNYELYCHSPTLVGEVAPNKGSLYFFLGFGGNN